MIQFIELQEKDIKFLSDLLNDAQIVSALHNAVMDYNGWLETYNRYWKADKDEKHFIIYSDEAPVGWLKLNGLVSREIAWISMLAISTTQQNKGIGKQAIKFSEEYVKCKGFKMLGIHTTEDNLIARSLYEKCGYKVTEYGECTTGDGTHRMGYTFIKDFYSIETCIFCNYKNDKKGTLLFENNFCVCIDQNHKETLIGSCIIIPKAHKITVFDLSYEEWEATKQLIDKVKSYLDSKYNPDGYNIGWNCGAAGGQDVFHAHLHIIPRHADEPRAGDGIRHWIKQKENKRPL